MKAIFISYRRQDSAATAGRLHDHLTRAFGADRVFQDVSTIEAGSDFVTEIEGAIAKCDTMLVLIGKAWADPGAAGARLYEADDFVRAEVAGGIAAGLKVIPVLVDGAAMPEPGDLPDELHPLTRMQAVELRNAHFNADAQGLISTIRGDRPRTELSTRTRILAVAVGFALGLLAYVLFGIAHKMLLGQALDMTLGRGMTIALFPLFGMLGAWLALKRVNGLTDAA